MTTSHTPGQQLLRRLWDQKIPKGAPPLGVLNRVLDLLSGEEPQAALLDRFPVQPGFHWRLIAATETLLIIANAKSQDEYSFYYEEHFPDPATIWRLDQEAEILEVTARSWRAVTKVSAAHKAAEWTGALGTTIRPAWVLSLDDGTELRVPGLISSNEAHASEAERLVKLALRKLSDI